MRNARVFISCGQRTSREKNIGKSVQDYFGRRGFETYLAERVHSSDALTDNIFRFLKQSEYFVFIDFKREKIGEGNYRGSLFVNQEIAIATFLKLVGIGFCEKETKREGILGYHIYNAFGFEDGREIFGKLEKETEKWDKSSVNELKIIYDPGAVSRGFVLQNNPQKPLSDWYHLEVRNRHKTRHAFSCLGYVTRVIDLRSGNKHEIPTIELIWSGLGEIMVNIMGHTSRELDAFWFIQGENQIRFHQRALTTTNPKYRLPDLPPGKYLIEYTVVSSSFETVAKSYILEFEDCSRDLTLREAE